MQPIGKVSWAVSEMEMLVSAISAVAYGKNFGFIGLYICHPDHRGQGLWHESLAGRDETAAGGAQ